MGLERLQTEIDCAESNTYATLKGSVDNKNKRPMGHIAHLRNQFKSMNIFERSYDYIYKFIIKLFQ